MRLARMPVSSFLDLASAFAASSVPQTGQREAFSARRVPQVGQTVVLCVEEGS